MLTTYIVSIMGVNIVHNKQIRLKSEMQKCRQNAIFITFLWRKWQHFLLITNTRSKPGNPYTAES
jgi:hypothetical protein